MNIDREILRKLAQYRLLVDWEDKAVHHTERVPQSHHPMVFFTDLNGTVGETSFLEQNALVYEEIITSPHLIIPTTQISLQDALRYFFSELSHPPLLIVEGGNVIAVREDQKRFQEKIRSCLPEIDTCHGYEVFLLGSSQRYLETRLQSLADKNSIDLSFPSREGYYSLSTVLFADPLALPKIRKHAEQANLELYATSPTRAVMGTLSVSKGKAASFLEDIGLLSPFAPTIGVGNDSNDVSLLKYVDLPFFIGSPQYELRTHLPDHTFYLPHYSDWIVFQMLMNHPL